jgi:hypothetical protein
VLKMSVDFARAGWFYFHEDGHLKRLYGRRWDSNDKEVRVIYGNHELRTFKQSDILKTEEDIYVPDYYLKSCNYLEVVK